MKRQRRKYNLSRIRQRHSYTVQEITELFGIHKNTVRQWERDGLPKIDDQRPHLFHGEELKRFLSKKQASRKRACKRHEIYCCRCRQPREAWGNLAEVVFLSPRLVNLTALCAKCEAPMNRGVSLKDLPVILQTFDIQTARPPHIIETLPPAVKCYFEEMGKK